MPCRPSRLELLAMQAGELLGLLRARTAELSEVEELLARVREHLDGAAAHTEQGSSGESSAAIADPPAWDWDTPPQELEQFIGEQRQRLEPLIVLLCKRRHELATLWLDMAEPPEALAARVDIQLEAQLEHRRSERDQDIAELRVKLSRIRSRRHGPRARSLRDRLARLEAMTDEELLRTRS